MVLVGDFCDSSSLGRLDVSGRALGVRPVVCCVVYFAFSTFFLIAPAILPFIVPFDVIEALLSLLVDFFLSTGSAFIAKALSLVFASLNVPTRLTIGLSPSDYLPTLPFLRLGEGDALMFILGFMLSAARLIRSFCSP